MEEASVNPYDESSSEDNNQSVNGETVGLAEHLYPKSILLDIVNGCDLSRMTIVEKAAANDHLQLEENLQSEDLINNNKGASEQECFTNQRLVTSGDATAIKDQLAFSDNHKELFFIPSEDGNRVEYKETLNPVHDSAQCSDKNKEHIGGELYNGQTMQVLENHAMKRNIDNIAGSSGISQDQQEHEAIHRETKTVGSELHDLCGVDLLSLKQNPEDQEESPTIEFSLYKRPKQKDCLKLKNFNDKSMSGSKKLIDNNSELTLSFEAPAQNVGAIIGCQDLFDDLCNNLHSEECNETNNHSDLKNHAKHLQNSQCDSKTGTPKLSSVGHLDLLANSTVCESERVMKAHSLDFQAKHTGISLPKSDGTRKNKRKKEHQPRKGGRCGPHYEIETVLHELDLDENLSDKEESSEDDNIDNSLHYGSRERLDHRKERHQYVSDKLDPDVLQLLEMHLRKQQLVDIKEEGEEELVDVHINKEKSRSESFKLLRNIPPVLDMVLEEPELEHAGDLLEESSKSPSDLDSDDSSNVCAMEICLIESLQHDLMSKSSKKDQHKIATIMQTSSPETLSRENKSKQKAGALHHHDCKIKCESIINKEPDTHLAQMRESSDLQPIQVCSAIDGDYGSAFVSECAAVGNVHDMGMQSECSISDSWKDLPEQPVPLNNTEDFVTEKISMGELDHSYQCLRSKSLDKGLDSDAHQKRVSDAMTHATHTGTTLNESIEDAFSGSETTFTESVKTENISSVPCPTFDGGNLKPHANIAPSLETKISSFIEGSEKANSRCPSDGSDVVTGNNSTDQHDGADNTLGSEDLSLTDLNKDLQANMRYPYETMLTEPPAEDMSTLRLDLKEKILSILQKAHAADCRSARLKAEAELLWKESLELRNECKSLSMEATELFSIFAHQEAMHSYPTRESTHKMKTEGSLQSDTKPRYKETLNFNSKANTRSSKKGADQLQFLSKEYNFLRQEAPEIMRDLHVLQQDLKSLPTYHSKPINFLYRLMWGGLITGGTMLFIWWSNNQLGSFNSLIP